jgi:hypothetical protein
MKQLFEISSRIRSIRCDKELGWLQMRLLVLTLMNALIPLTYHQKLVSVEHFRNLQVLYKDFLQVPFEHMDDKLFCHSIKNEVVAEIDALLATEATQAAA